MLSQAEKDLKKIIENENPLYENGIDLKGKYVVPGFIDAHTHLGIFEDGLNFEGDDCNEDTEPITPHLRAIDAINPMENCFLSGCLSFRIHCHGRKYRCRQ